MSGANILYYETLRSRCLHFGKRPELRQYILQVRDSTMDVVANMFYRKSVVSPEGYLIRFYASADMTMAGVSLDVPCVSWLELCDSASSLLRVMPA